MQCGFLLAEPSVPRSTVGTPPLRIYHVLELQIPRISANCPSSGGLSFRLWRGLLRAS